ncbi:MAG: Oligopeptide transport ATP-binding protein OppD [Phycisphaerae bacterium]|nr:Oligopeptide transport ATP-binding protein OppD [Phycisphaerae bacterium]
MRGMLLSVRDLRVQFHVDGAVVPAVDGVDLDIPAGRTVALVGESGSGKSVTALSIMRLVPSPPARIAGGTIQFESRDLLRVPEREMRRLRGNRIAMIFQEPMTSLNPVFTVGEQIGEALRLHQRLRGGALRARVIDMLRKVGIPAPEQRAREYPHQMSGGMRQRVMIAMALSCRPALLIADEPTTALDVTIQAQILGLLRGLQRETGMSILIITHDFGVAAELADYVCVMYAGRVVEQAPAVELYRRPLHPYTIGLFRSMPRLSAQRDRLYVIPGQVPDPTRLPAGCRFHPRCEHAAGLADCHTREPPLEDFPGERRSACWRSAEIGQFAAARGSAAPGSST